MRLDLSPYAAKAEILDPGADAFLEKAKRRIKGSRDAFQSQRDREEADLRFQVPEYQWDESARQARRGGSLGGVETSARPTLSVSKIDQPIQLVNNQARNAKLGVNIHPVSEKANKETAEVKQGIYRRIERDSNANQARLWAFDRASKAGMGAYIVRTKFDEDAPETFDQEIVIDRILYQNMVGFDPAAQKPDFSDGEFSWLGAWMTVETFGRTYPNARYSTADAGEFSDLASADPDWIDGDGDERHILVVEYFYKIHTLETFAASGRERQRDNVTIGWAVITAAETLEQKDWNGHYLPIIAVPGRELQPFKSERRWVGMIAPAKDGQRLYNYAVSTAVESMQSEPKAPFLVAEGQIEGYEDQWKQANTRNLAYLTYKPTTIAGAPAPPPQRMQVDTSKMQLATMMAQEADNFIQATTSVYDPSLGRQTSREKSGRAILALQSQSDAGTSHFLSTFTDVSLAYEARVVLDLMPAIYDRPGRVVRILGAEDDDRTVMINAPFVMDGEGRPQPAGETDPHAKVFALAAGSYTISTSIGKSHQTRLEQGSEEIGAILAASPELMPMIGPTYFRFRDFPGATEIADILKKMRDKQFPGLDKKPGDTPTAEEAQAEVQALKAQMQQMQQMLQAAKQALETDQAKQQASLQKAEIDNAAKVEIARLHQQAAARDDALKLTLEKMSQQFEAVQAELTRAHEERLAHEKMAHEVALAASQPKPTGNEW